MGAGVGALVTAEQVWTVVVRFKKATPAGTGQPLDKDDPIYKALKAELDKVLDDLTPAGQWKPTKKAQNTPTLFIGGDVLVAGDLSLSEAHDLNCLLDKALQTIRTVRAPVKGGQQSPKVMTIHSTGVAAVVTDNITPAGQSLGPIDDCLEVPAVRTFPRKAKVKVTPKAKR